MRLAVLRRGLESLLEFIVVVLLVLLAAIVFLGVVYRTLGDPFSWYDEVASVMLAWLTYYGAALAALKRAHISTPSLVNTFPPKVRVGLALVSELCVIAFFAVMGWYGWIILELLAGDTLVSIEIPVEITQSVIPLGSALFILAELLILPEVLRDALAGKQQHHEEPIPAEVTR